jgi:ferredoxin
MADRPRTILICSCEDTMPLDAEAVRRGCRGSQVTTARQLCRVELDKFRKAAATAVPLTVGCTQESPLFSEIAEDAGNIRYVNIRETAGWSADAASAGPKMAGLIAAAAEPAPDVPFVSFTSEGVILVYGRNEQAIEAGSLLKDHLDVTVLIRPPADVAPPRVTDFPVVKGTIRTASGHLGSFELTVDGYAQPAPSSRGAFAFAAGRDGAVSHCDVVLDLSGGTPLFSAADLRDGYLRADPGDPAAMLKAVLKARDLVGTFDKPRYITFTADICAHSRSGIVGCNRCLDLCPTGAIAPAGDHVAIDAHICAGCGQCAAVCPTGAASYALPPADVLMRKLRALLTAYREQEAARRAAALTRMARR